MYHYVRPPDFEAPYLKHLALDDFRLQLDYFAATDRLIGIDEFIAILNGEPVPDDGTLLTFDDGLLDHYTHVFPELTKRNAAGLFFVPTQPLTDNRALDVHRVHWLLGRHGGAEPLAALGSLVKSVHLVHAHVDEFRTQTYKRQDNDAAVTQFKRTLNYYITDIHRRPILDALMAWFDAPDLVNSLYINSEQIWEMANGGMLIGSHSIGHPVMSTLSRSDQQREIAGSFSVLEHLLGPLCPRVFCYPYGGFYSFTHETEDVLSQVGCLCAFNVEPRSITNADIRNRPQALPRFDCNEFTHGRACPDRDCGTSNQE